MSKLATMVARIRNTPGLGMDTALLLGVVALGLISSAYLFVHYQVITPFSHDSRFSAEFDQAPAYQPASRQELRIAGVSVGKIVGAQVADDGNAKVTFSIQPGHPVYKDARLVWRSKTPLNVMYVTLDPGTPAAGRLGPNDVIPVSQTQRQTQPYELLDQLDARSRAALTDLVTEADVALADAPAKLPSGLNATSRTAASFQPVVDALAQRRDNLAHLVTAVSQISTAAGGDSNRLAQLAADLETTLSVVSERDNELGASIDQLPGVTSTLRSSMASAAALSNQLSPALSSLSDASRKLPQALGDLTTTVEKAGSVVTTARPVIAKARPVVADLSPLTSDLHSALGDLSPVTSNLPDATAKLVPWLNDLGAFVYNTSSSFSLGDANGGMGRADLVLKLYDPTGGGIVKLPNLSGGIK